MATPEQQKRNQSATMEDRIFITHYVNPHQFWYKPFHPGSKKTQQKQLQDAIDEYCEEHYLDQSVGHYEPVFGEVVAFYDPSLNRWTRCTVDGVKLIGKGTQTFRLWSIDEGCPRTVDIEQIRPLPNCFHDRSSSCVKRGSIKNIFPAQCLYDPQEEKLTLKECSKWAETANTMLRSFIEGTQQLCFTSVTPYTVAKETIHFGDLLFVTKNKKFNAVNLLAENSMGLMVESKNFIIQMLEMDKSLVSRTSSMVSVLHGSTEETCTNALAEKQQRHESMTLEGMSELEFDESVSTVGVTNTQPPVAPAPQPLPAPTAPETDNSSSRTMIAGDEGKTLSSSSGSKKSMGLAQKLKLLKARSANNASLNSSKPRSASSTTGSLASAHCSGDPFEQIRKDAYALTIDVGMSEQAEHELLTGGKPTQPTTSKVAEVQIPKERAVKAPEKENKPIKKEEPKPATIRAAELKTTHVKTTTPQPKATPTNSTDPKEATPSSNGMISETPAGNKITGGTLKQRLLQKIAKAQQLKLKESEAQQTKPTGNPLMSFAPAGIQNDLLGTAHQELVPTVQSNAVMKKFEKVIQGEKCIFSRRSHYRVLVHGSKTPKPIDRIAAANFSPRVHLELEQLGFTTLHRLQAYSWPHILRENSFICVNGVATGKTFAYLPAVCSVVQRQIEESLVPAVAGPVAIIVTYTSREVQRIAFFCRKLLHSEAHAELAVLECYGIRDVTKICNLLYNGCAILITTAPAYRRLYELTPEAFVRKRIQTVVIDNIEEILPHFAPELQMLCKNCDKEGLQMIVTAGYWIPMLAKFLRRYRNMVICIGAFLEAAVYAKARFSILSFVGEERKQIELIRHLKEHDYRSERTIVFGNDSDDLVPIVEALRQNSINHIVGNERMVLQQHSGFSNWDERAPGDMMVLVCSDTVLGDLKICQAQHIIHYSLATTWSTFTRRYACSFGYYECPYLPAKANEKKGGASSLVLLSAKNNQQLPRLVDFLELHQYPVQDSLVVHAQKIRSLIEGARVADGRAVSMLCTYILGFAVCRNVRNCVYRHTLTLDDMAPETVPRSGRVRMKICHVFSPVHFAVRLEAHRPAGSTDWTVLNDTERFLLQDIAMQAHFANESRHQMHGNPHRNDLCAVFDDQNYWRCKIINYDESKVDNGEVQLLLIDTGRIMHTKAFSLLHLPDRFRVIPGQAINVRIAAVAPHDYEQDWDKLATQTVRRWIENYITRPNCSIQGNVLLALKDTVWIDELYLVEELDGVKTTVTSERIRASLIAKKYGVGDRESFEKIRQLVQDCETYGIQSLPLETHGMEKQRSNGSERSSSGAGGMDSVEDVVKLTGDVSFDSAETLKMIKVDVPLKYDQGLKMSDDEAVISSEEEKDDIKELLEKTYIIDYTEQQPITRRLKPADLHDDEESEDIDEANVSKNPEIDRTTTSEEICDAMEDTEKDQKLVVPVEADVTISSSSSSFEVLSPTQDAKPYEFDSLQVGRDYSVMIGHYLAPDDFYISQSNRIHEVDTLIKEYTKESSTLIPLKSPRPGQHCLALFENVYYRARVINVLKESAAVETDIFLLDFGGIVRCDTLYRATEHLLRSVPFLAIKGSFAHIQPPNGAQEWDEETANAIYDRWLEQYNQGSMFAVIQHVLPWTGTDRIEGCHRYDMLLGDGNAQDLFSIVKDIVYDGLAMWVRNEDGTSTIADVDDDDDNFTQVNFTHEELMDLMRKASSEPRNGNATSRAIKHADDSPRIVELPVEKKQDAARLAVSKSQETSEDERSVIKRAARKQKRTLKELRLECDYRVPATVWDQDKYFVVLRVHAPDVIRYNLTISQTSLLLQFVKEDENQRYMLGLTLRNPVVPSDSAHAIRGLSIVIRLRKLVLGKRWPTLDTIGSKKLKWVQFGRGADGESSSDEMVKENRWKDMMQAHLDNSSSIDSVPSGTEEQMEDSDAEDEDRVFLGMG